MGSNSNGHLIWRYPNRKLYDTVWSGYMTLRQLRSFVLEGEPFEVRNKATGNDETHSVLCQILYSQAVDGGVFSSDVLTDLIRETEETLKETA